MRRIQSRRRSNRRRNFGSRTGSGSDRRQRNRNRSQRSKSRSRGRGSAVRGWAKKSPNRKWKRREMFSRYGSRCFLDSKNLKYPICDRNGKIDRRGVQAAYNRSRQYHHNEIARKAKRLLSR
jgi:hypothetical protein